MQLQRGMSAVIVATTQHDGHGAAILRAKVCGGIVSRISAVQPTASVITTIKRAGIRETCTCAVIRANSRSNAREQLSLDKMSDAPGQSRASAYHNAP